jgi:hypothetical protein
MGAQCQPPKQPAPKPPEPTGLSISPTSIDFGDVPVGTGKLFTPVNVTNHGPDTVGPLSVSFLSLMGPAYVSVQSTPGGPGGLCGGAVLAAGESCFVNAEFDPFSTGSFPAQLIVGDPAKPGVLVTASLTGTGT